jgi:23S rRNA (adenine1618-N6)-methyltransferase
MTTSTHNVSPGGTTGRHRRNRHGARYDFPALVKSCPKLAPFVTFHSRGGETIDFANPAAVMMLNCALLMNQYGIEYWAIPPGYLCPPIPGRADYIHHVADLFDENSASAVVLDIGVGANCIYPIIGVAEYGWRFVGSDIDPISVKWANKLVAANRLLAGKVECRLQNSATNIFNGVVKRGEKFDLSICNPPFHASREEAESGTLRKLRNLGDGTATKPVLNFGGQGNELWCQGGELGFVKRMIEQSAEQPQLCRWFTTLVSKQGNLPAIHRALKGVHAKDVRTIEMNYGQKKSRIVAWTFG